MDEQVASNVHPDSSDEGIFGTNFRSGSSEKIRSFNCGICGESLNKRGHQLDAYTFGRLVINMDSRLAFHERQFALREFSLPDLCDNAELFDCDKVISTPCGHIFHTGCLREWFFLKRQERIARCPFCSQRATYDDCIVLHGLAYSPEDEEEDAIPLPDTSQEIVPTKDMPPNDNPDYSDISCASSTWSSEDSDETDSDRTSDASNDPISQSRRQRREYGEDEIIDELEVLESEVDEISTGLKGRRRFWKPNYKRMFNLGKVAVGYIDKFNLLYLIVLYWTFELARECFKIRKDVHSFEEEFGDDDVLARVSENLPNPFGYALVVQVILTFVGILIYEHWLDTVKVWFQGEICQ